MSDKDTEPEEENLDKLFEAEPEDDIKPIDIGERPDTIHNPPPPPAKPAQEPEPFLKDSLDEKPMLDPMDYVDETRNFAAKGDFKEITEKKPGLHKIKIGVGWDQRDMEEEPIDLDVSLFLLNIDNVTRVDEDFIFYNQPIALDGAVKHDGDNRTGAGDGDDESITIDLNGVPFDIMKIMIVLSVYDQDMQGHHIQMTKNIFVRIVDEEEREEVIRFEIPEEELTTATAMKMAALVREGPKWYFEALAEPVIGGLGKVATEYELIIQEMMASGDA